MRPQGLYDGQHEHDACGVAFVATLSGEPSHDIVDKALTALRNLEHRGASGADSGDGAGILLQIPDAFLRAVVDFTLPERGSYAVGTAFLPADEEAAANAVSRIEELAAEEGLTVLGWRDVPVTPSLLGATSLATMPTFRQLFVGIDHGRDRAAAGAACLLPAQARRARDGRLLRELVRPHAGLQGDAHDRAARAVLPRPVRPPVRERPRGCALALLDQHLPELAARAPVPLHLPQRRDQHRAGQPQLDAGPRVAACERADPGRPRSGSSRSPRRAPATPRRSTRCSSCCTWAGAPCRTPC